MVVGCLGDVAFSVSSRTVQTINNLKWSGGARYTTHYVHGSDGLLEYTGTEPDTVTLDIVLLASLGANPMSAADRIAGYAHSGRAVSLIIGSESLGRYRWVVSHFDVKAQHFDARGNITSATVSVSLKEYLR